MRGIGLLERFEFTEVSGDSPPLSLCRAVTEGMEKRPKCLPTHFLYDRTGSELFEQITDLPEYYPTRTERAILKARAREIVEAVGHDVAIIEFGSGSSAKTRLLIEAAFDRQSWLRYMPIDISHDFLKVSSSHLLARYPGLGITAIGGEYFDAADQLPGHSGPRLIIFLGSNIGNLEMAASVDFLTRIARRMSDADRLLVGIDLVKEVHLLEAAYNDSAGVTAAFNLNLLKRINRELDGHFEIDRFRHHAPYDSAANRIEMRLHSVGSQRVSVEAIDRVYDFGDDEFIHTEWSHKYTPESFATLSARAGLAIDHLWTDERDWFALCLLRARRP